MLTLTNSFSSDSDSGDEISVPPSHLTSAQLQPVDVGRSQLPEVASNKDLNWIAAKELALNYCKHGRNLLEAKEYTEALSTYQIASSCDPQLAIAHSGLAQAYYLLKDYQNALLEANRAIECDYSQTDFYFQRALIFKALNNYTQVLADCRHILERTPHHSSARWLHGIALVKTGNYQVALFSFNQHIDTHPQDPNGYCYLGICHDQLEKHSLALADFDRAIALQPNNFMFHHARGRTRHKLGDLGGALADFNITIDLKPELAAVYDDRAEVYRSHGDYLAALKDCDRAIALNPSFIDAYFRRGLTHAELGDLQLALADFNSTIDLHPEHAKAYIQRSWIYFRQNNYKLAKQDCQEVKSFDQVCFCANYMLGIVNSFSGLEHNAIGNFSKSIKIFPYYVSARYHRGILYYDLGDIPKAMADFEQARSIQDRGLERLVDRDETGFYAEGLALYYMGQPEAARTVLNLGALSAKRFNNPIFHKQILFNLEALGLASSDLSA